MSDEPPCTEPARGNGIREEPIAVIGIGLRFPGSDSPETFWEQIISGRSGIVPGSRRTVGRSRISTMILIPKRLTRPTPELEAL